MSWKKGKDRCYAPLCNIVALSNRIILLTILWSFRTLKGMSKSQRANFVDLILDSIADGVFTIDQDFRITSFNRAAEEMTRLFREEAVRPPDG